MLGGRLDPGPGPGGGVLSARLIAISLWKDKASLDESRPEVRPLQRGYITKRHRLPFWGTIRQGPLHSTQTLQVLFCTLSPVEDTVHSKVLSTMDSSPQDPSYSHIQSLPDELLLEIFSAVKTWRPSNNAKHIDFASSSQDIGSVRLVCRRFAAASSHLLVHYVRLNGINPQSVAKLESISRHPLLSKGVRIVRLESLYYTSNLALHFEEFARHAINQALSRVRHYKQNFDSEIEQAEAAKGLAGSAGLWEREIEVTRILDKVKAVLKTWARTGLQRSSPSSWRKDMNCGVDDDKPLSNLLNLVGEDEKQVEGYAHLLRLAHRMYQLRYDEQENLSKENVFVERVGAAMARMPKARSLEVHDFCHGSTSYSSCQDMKEQFATLGAPDGDVLASLLEIESLIKPMSWSDGLDQQLGDPPAEVLFTLPVAIQKAGGKLDRISVHTTVCAENFYPLLRKTMMDEYHQLGSAIHAMGVKSFTFMHGNEGKARARKTPGVKDVDAFLNYVDAMSSSECLERLRVVVDSGWSDGSLDPDHDFNFRRLVAPGADSISILGSCSRQKLTDIHLSNVPVYLSDLEGLAIYLRDSKLSLRFLTLSRINLLTGTWSQALELLRELDVADTEVIEPFGAECEDPAMLLSGRYEEIFRTELGRVSVAERFVNGELKQNPLKEDWAVDLVDSIHGEEEVGTVVTKMEEIMGT